jgi:hypothetical protein
VETTTIDTSVESAVNRTIEGFALTEAGKQALAARASGVIEVTSATTCMQAKMNILRWKKGKKIAQEWWSPITKSLHAAWKTANDKANEFIKPFDDRIKAQASNVDEWEKAQEAERAPWEDEPIPVKVDGLIEREGPVKVRVTDLYALIIAAGKLLETGDDSLAVYLSFNEKHATEMARKVGKTFEEMVPGVEVYRDKVLAQAPSKNGSAPKGLFSGHVELESSSQIFSVCYQNDVLQVCFRKGDKPGAVWNYNGVEIDHFFAIQEAESAGRYLNEHIKSNKNYRAEKVAA